MFVGESWPDWRNDADDALRARLDGPIDGVIFDVQNGRFWRLFELDRARRSFVVTR